MGYLLTIQHDGQLTNEQSEDYFTLTELARYGRLMIDLGMAHDTGEGPQWDPQHPTATTGTAPTIPSHKLIGSNDEWWITADEITAALAVWDAQAEDSIRRLGESFGKIVDLPADEQQAFFDQHRKDTTGILDLGTMHPESWAAWIDYLRLAAAHNGICNS